MRYSSHLYLRTDGTLGRFPIIEVNDQGIITAITECGDAMSEIQRTRFFSGVIVPAFTACGDACQQLGYMYSSDLIGDNLPLVFSDREDFLHKVNQLSAIRAQQAHTYPQHGAIAIGSAPDLLLIEGFDLNTFCSKGATICRLSEKR